MSAEIAVIIAAAIGAVGTIIAGIFSLSSSMRSMEKQNTIDHGVVQERLAGIREDVLEIKGDVKEVSNRLDDHVTWHLEQKD